MTRTPRTRLRTVLLSLAALLLAVVLGFLVWASLPMQAEAAPLADAGRGNHRLIATQDAVVLAPDAPGPSGIVFLAGARVDPAAYANKFSGLADAGVTVVIVRPLLNFAILETRPLSDFTALAPGVERWVVGGHSLGGVRACQYAADSVAAKDGVVSGLLLAGSYCSANLSATGLPVLSLGGENDGLSTPDKIADARGLLPTSATLVEIPGANHASFGDYGVQPGDGVATATDDAVRTAITTTTLRFLDSLAT